MNTALPQKFPFILDRNLTKANCTRNRVCTSRDIVVLDSNIQKMQCHSPAFACGCQGNKNLRAVRSGWPQCFVFVDLSNLI